MDAPALLLMLADDAANPAAPANVWHIVGLGVGLAGSIFASARAVVGWLGRHFERSEAAAREREERDAKTIATQRTDFLAALDGSQQRFVTVLDQREAECRAERLRDREQHAHETRLIFKLIGLPAPGDTGKFKVSETEAPKEKKS